MSHNVPAVYDVLPARIRACVARPGLAKCGWSDPWEWSVAERPRRTEPRSDRRERSIYRPVMRSGGVHYNASGINKNIGS
jgi:hypothetical protein